MIRATQGKFAGQIVPVKVFAEEAKSANPSLRDYDDETVADYMIKAFPQAYSWHTGEAKQESGAGAGSSDVGSSDSGGISSYMMDIAKNFPSSFGNTILNTITSLAYIPLGIGALGSGVVKSMNKALGYDTAPTVPGIDETAPAILKGLSEYYKSRYFEPGAFKETLRTDPAGVMQDVADVISLATPAAGYAASKLGAKGLGNALKSAGMAAMWLDPGYATIKGGYDVALHGPISRLAEQKLRSILKYEDKIDPNIISRHMQLMKEQKIPVGPSGIAQIDRRVEEITDLLTEAVESADKSGTKVSLGGPISALKKQWDSVHGANANEKLEEIYKFAAAPVTTGSAGGAGVINKFGGALRQYYVRFRSQDQGGILNPGNMIGPFISESDARKYIARNSHIGPADVIEGEPITFYPGFDDVIRKLRQNYGERVKSDVLDPVAREIVYLDEHGNAVRRLFAPRDLSIKEANLLRKAENLDYELNRAYQQMQKGAIGAEYMKARLEFDKALRDAIYDALESSGLGTHENWRRLMHESKDLIDIRDQIERAIVRSGNENPLGGTNPYVVVMSAVMLSDILAGRLPQKLATVVAAMGGSKYIFGKNPELLSKVLYRLMSRNPSVNFWRSVAAGVSIGRPLVIGEEEAENRRAARNWRIVVEQPKEKRKQDVPVDVGPDPFGTSVAAGQSSSGSSVDVGVDPFAQR